MKKEEGYFREDELILVGKRNDELQCCPLEIGDNVILASGSPVMEVIEINIKNFEYRNGVKCSYNIVGDENIEHTFERECLVKLIEGI